MYHAEWFPVNSVRSEREVWWISPTMWDDLRTDNLLGEKHTHPVWAVCIVLDLCARVPARIR
jgi:hypothetical protein